MSIIESILQESRTFPPHQNFVTSSHLSDWAQFNKISTYAKEYPDDFWRELAADWITWHQPFTKVMRTVSSSDVRWFEDGILNVSFNCLDRHLPKLSSKTALIFENDAGHSQHISYRELYTEVCRCANALRSLGIKKGDRVMIYMSTSPQAIIAIQACARIGAIHSVVFAGFSSQALADRIDDAKASLVITANHSVRGGKSIKLKHAVDEALLLSQLKTVTHVLIYERDESAYTINTERDIIWNEYVSKQADVCEPEWMNAEDPLFILYTSGSTGTPKGIVHSTAGYFLGAIYSLHWIFDIHEHDIYYCTADVGWITGHSYVAYAPLALGITQVIFEGIPTHPNSHRIWSMIERYRVNILYTAPTAIRTLMSIDSLAPRQHDLSSLRLLGSVGEPINPEAWMWYHSIVGQEQCPIVDTWWQTETGSIMIAPCPGAVPTKPGSCTLPIPGISIALIDEEGKLIIKPRQGGTLIITRPFPSRARGIWGNQKRFEETYFPDDAHGYYVTGDSAHQDEDGYVWILGRIDDVLNVSGHRIGTMEIESALASHPSIAEAAVVGRPEEIKGEAIIAFIVLKNALPDTPESTEALHQSIQNIVIKQIGKLAVPSEIRLGYSLPKTRSGKIMRRLLRHIATHNTIPSQDTSTLEQPEQLAQWLRPKHLSQ
jgi:acetyl-CoA synthetase